MNRAKAFFTFTTLTTWKLHNSIWDVFIYEFDRFDNLINSNKNQNKFIFKFIQPNEGFCEHSNSKFLGESFIIQGNNKFVATQMSVMGKFYIYVLI